MENIDMDKLNWNSINAVDTNEYLYDVYLGCTSDKADVRRGFKRFAATTGLKKRRYSGAVLYTSVAVAFASVLAAIFFAFFSKPYEANWLSVSTVAGETRELFLSDGSRIQMGPCSNVVFPDVFSNDTRKIFAVGDVYFDIAKDPDRLFVVSSDGIDVKVHGTLFHVYSYPGIDNQEVELAQGCVSVSFGGIRSEISLTPGEMLKYDKTHNVCQKKTFDIEAFKEQMTGTQIFFDNEDLSIIVQKLSNRFGTKIFICDNSLFDQRYYASFVNGEDLMEILSSLGRQGDFSVQQTGDIYKLMR